MNTSLQRIKGWRSRRQLRSLQRWEQIRAKGKARCVLQSALTYSITMIGAIDVYQHLFGTQGSISLEKTIFYLLVGIVIGFDSWNTMEGKYKNALIDARVKASPSGELLLHNNALQVTADSKSE